MEAFAFVDAGLTWGMPVKADVLVQQLQKYAQVRTVRLCHLFGRGLEVHISKLPAEVRLMIEKRIMESTSDADAEVATAFYHFENKCRPVDHLVTPEAYAELALDMQRRFGLTICEACQVDLAASVVLSGTPGRCECKAKLESKMNDWLKDEAQIVADCEKMAKRWSELIDQEGGFAKYDELLRKDFGLEAYIRKNESDYKWEGRSPYWRRLAGGRFGWRDPTRTTMCYLTVPNYTQTPPPYHCPQSSDGYDFCGLQPYFVNLKGLLSRQEERVEQFTRVRRALRIEAYAHRGNRRGENGEFPRIIGPNDGERSPSPGSHPPEWPQLVVLIHTSVRVEDAEQCQHRYWPQNAMAAQERLRRAGLT